jgi:hypothetical protein
METQQPSNDNDDTNGLFGLIRLTDFNSFKFKLHEFMKKNNYENSNNELIFTNDVLCICNISKKIRPNWFNGVIYEVNNLDEIRNVTYYRIIIFRYQPNIYYIERSGNINMKLFLKTFNLMNFDRTIWVNTIRKLNDNANFNEKIINYLSNIIKDKDEDILQKYRTNINDITLINNLSTIINKSISNININNLMSVYENIPKLNNAEKLINYNHEDCIKICENGTTKSTETKYNENVHNQMIGHELLDRILIKGCEIADIYNRNTNTFFHNKKSEDLRCLCFQIMIGALILKNTDYFNEYNEILQRKNIFVNIDTNSFKFVAGIIRTTEIHFKDKISLAITYNHLKQMGIELYIDDINVINFPEKLKKELKPKKEPKLKNK